MTAAPDRLPDAGHGLDIEELTELLDAVPSLVVVVDAQGRYAYANQAAWDWLGLTPDQLLGRPVREVLGDEAYATIAPRVDGARAGARQSFERSMSRPDGTVVHTLTEYVPRFRAGRPDGFVAVVTDQTRQVRAENAHAAGRRRVEELTELNRAAAGTSDEVLQELFAIGLHLERMRRLSDQNLDGAAPVLDSLSRTIDRLRESIKQLAAEAQRPSEVGTIASEQVSTARSSVGNQ